MKYMKPAAINLKTHPVLDERWVQQRIAEDPTIIGLGDIVVRDRERIHPSAGRLDLLCQDAESTHRYEIEIQLGRTDESHVIRTIEYWDVERKRYPQYDHTAVLIAEDITSRFLNVISLFNGYIPFVAIQMQALQFGEDTISLVFTRVLDETRLGLIDEDEEINEPADRDYWEKRASKSSLVLADECISLLREIDATLQPKYNKHYIGLARQGQPDNFVLFNPKKSWVVLRPRLSRDPEIDKLLEEAGLEFTYRDRDERYRVPVKADDVKHRANALRELFRRSFEQNKT